MNAGGFAVPDQRWRGLPWRLDPDEHWRLSYQIACDGMPDVKFSIVVDSPADYESGFAFPRYVYGRLFVQVRGLPRRLYIPLGGAWTATQIATTPTEGQASRLIGRRS
jgi:hypothetical protein